MARRLLFLYLALLLLSHAVSLLRGSIPPDEKPGYQAIEVAQREGTEALAAKMRLGFLDLPAAEADAPTLVLLHGSPGDGDALQDLVAAWKGKYRLIVPDLPGFGASARELPDYSFAGHAAAVGELLDALRVPRAHFLAFSMGGGVALHLAEAEPQRVKSITMLAAIGVQELELFGKYELNHAVHGFQLLALKGLAWFTPHFGALRSGNGAINYARNFYDSDQRPLRGILESWQGPMLIVHGESDPLVPVAAAREHARIVPQAELVVWSDANHFLPWRETERVSTKVHDFLARVESGQARNRAQAEPAAILRAQQAWNPADAPELLGFALVIMMILLAAATLVTEDLTCIFTGLLIAQGRIAFLPGTAACFIGILIGDGLLFLLGRWLGRPALARAPLRWMVRPRAVYRASSWFEHRGGKVILLSRFLPGLRLPTYVAAGMLGQKLRTFFFYFALAGLLWTPILVGISTWAGKEVLEALHAVEGYAVPILVLLAISLFLAQKLILPLFTRRGRRLLYGSIRRKFEWEFWPPQVFYLPVLIQILGLAIRYRGLRLVTAVNPGIPTGGLVGESKWQIFAALGMDPKHEGGAYGPAADALPLSCLLPATHKLRAENALAYLDRHGLDYPVILKPDRGERGRGVELVRNREQLERRLRIDPTDLLLQEFVPGQEFGVFFVREAGAERGKILSINGKRMLQLVGDGKRNLERLILDDDQAVRLAEVHFEYHAERLYEVPAAGETIHLVEVGAHARGSVFLDRRELISEALTDRINEIASAFPDFHFGRFDLRAPSEEAMREGRDLKILELNGLTAEVAHIYDPSISLWTAWRDIMQQWRIAFRIAAENRRAGAKASSWGEILADWNRARREHRSRDQALLEAEIAEEEAREKPATNATPAPSVG